MNKTKKIWLVIATLLVVLGSITFLVVMSVLKWDFDKLNTSNYVTNTYNVQDEFRSISIDLKISDVKFKLAEDGKCRVECIEEEKSKHNVFVKDNTLFVEVNEDKAWYEYIGINIGSPKITIYLDKSEYEELLIKVSTGGINLSKDLEFDSVDLSSSTGSISVDEVNAGTLKLKTSTGKINVSNVVCEGDVNIKVSTGNTKLTNFKCKNLSSSGSTGDITLSNVIADETFKIERDTGDIRLEASDAESIYLETDTGDIEGSILTDKIFIAETDLGDINVPKTTEGGKCEIITDMGDINISIK